MNTSRVRVLFILLALFVMSCATAGNQMSTGDNVIHKTIASLDIKEDCAKAMPGQKIVYSFETSLPVNFNIHYHENGEVNYAVYEQGVSRMNSSYNVEKEQYYCLMWTNKNTADAQLDYSFKVTE